MTIQSNNLVHDFAEADSQGRRSKLARWYPLWLGFALGLMTILAYLPATQCGFIWDDGDYVESNISLRSVEGLGNIWFKLGATPQYYPLVHTSYWIEYHLWGLNPAGYHLINILLHAMSAVLLWRVLRILELPGAWLAAAIFAIHPVHVESVAWITERKNVLSGLFYFASLWAYLRYALSARNQTESKSSWKLYTLSLILFLGALFSKTVTCSLPAAILLIFWWKKIPITTKRIVPLIPFFVLGLALAMVTAWLEKTHVLAVGSAWDLSFLDRCLIAGRALWFYLGKLAWPIDLTFIYPRFVINSAIWWQYLFPIAYLALIVACFIARRRIGRGPLVAALFFAGTLLPALGFFNVYPMRYSFVADHFQYLASLGPIMLTASLIANWHRRSSSTIRLWGKGAGIAMGLALAVLTWRQCGPYKNLETLWLDTLQKNDQAWIAHNNLGVIRQQQGKLSEAIGMIRRSIELNPQYVEAHTNLGAALHQQGNTRQAIHHLQQALQIDPGHADAHVNLGVIYKTSGRLDQAIVHFRQAIELNTTIAQAHANLGLTLASQGNLDEAIQHYRQSLTLQPNLAIIHLGLGQALSLQGDIEESLIHLRRALEIAPRFAPAYAELGTALVRVNRMTEAINAFQQATMLAPRNPDFQIQLGNAHLQHGNRNQAIQAFRTALTIQPNHQPARQALETLLKP